MSGSEEMGYQDLPPELKALDGALKMVFGAPVDYYTLAEESIMKIPGFDYDLAWELLAAVQVRLETKYEDRLDARVADTLKKLRDCLGDV